MKLRGLLLAGLLLAGCATVPMRSGALQVEIEPQTLHPGDVVSVTVVAPPGTRSMNGRLDLAGSPVLALRSQDEGRTWSFRTQIPLGAVWKPGRYRVEIRGTGAGGEPLGGEAWVTAQ
jgi:hypothetical protein